MKHPQNRRRLWILSLVIISLLVVILVPQFRSKSPELSSKERQFLGVWKVQPNLNFDPCYWEIKENGTYLVRWIKNGKTSRAEEFKWWVAGDKLRSLPINNRAKKDLLTSLLAPILTESDKIEAISPSKVILKSPNGKFELIRVDDQIMDELDR